MPALLAAATRVLRLTFVRERPASDAPGAAPIIDFIAFGHECLVAGRLRLDADRLTDLLNGTDELELVDVVGLGLDGGVLDANRVLVPRRELVAVKAGDPRGRASLRRTTRQVAVTAAAGRYVMHGYIHGRPGADPMIHLGRRPPMIPLTDATIAYETSQGWRVEDASTLIVNRDVAEYFRLAKEDELARLTRQWTSTRASGASPVPRGTV
jgi:hypothetical protein